MRVILAGGSGFLGRALQRRLRDSGASVAVLTRQPRPDVADDIGWTPDGSAGPWARSLEGADAIVNLSGAGLADQRWTDARKQELVSSRILPTRSLVAAIATLSARPAVFVAGSAVGYYGARGDEMIAETEPPGSDFLATLCVDWEREAERASSLTRLVIVRTAPALHPEGGALAAMLLPFRLGVGGRLGSGTQYMPWIHLDDWVGLVELLMRDDRARGAFNVASPQPVTNAEFTRALGEALHRPTIVPMPAFALRLLLGELANSLVTGQRAVPARAEALGFRFRFPALEDALDDLLAE